MKKNILQMFLFIVYSMLIIIIVISPMVIFNGEKSRDLRNIFAMQKIAPQRLFIASWRNIKSLYIDPSMNNQDWIKWKYRYLKYIKTDEDVIVAVNTMLASLNDSYSSFYGTKKYVMQEKYIQDNRDVKILGKKLPSPAVIKLSTIAGMVTSAEVIKDSDVYPNPKKGDIILRINGYDMYGLEMNSAAKLIMGKSPIIKLEVLRNNKKEHFTVVQGSLGVNKVDGYPIKNNIIYIHVLSLIGQNAPKDFNKIFKQYNNTASGYIIDLRGDVGGLFLNSVYIADEIIRQGELVTIEYRTGNNITMYAKPSELDKESKPIVILINSKTASSSEILAGALRSNNKAVLVGKPTFGKNFVQQIIPMPNSTCINLTTAKYKFSNGFGNDGVLLPDFEVDVSGWDFIQGKDPQLEKACEIIENVNKNSTK
ncbi:MAG: S41 family peptidase [Candidatus Gastranaerophilaceae bacterium]